MERDLDGLHLGNIDIGALVEPQVHSATDEDGVWLFGLFWGLFMRVLSASEADRGKRNRDYELCKWIGG